MSRIAAKLGMVKGSMPEKGVNASNSSASYLMNNVLADDSSVDLTLITALTNFIAPFMQGDKMFPCENMHYYSWEMLLMLDIPVYKSLQAPLTVLFTPGLDSRLKDKIF